MSTVSTVKDASIVGASFLSVGSPEGLQEGLIQLATAIISWLSLKLFDFIRKKVKR